MIDLTQINLLQVIGTDTHLKRVGSTNGGESAGACPRCGGKDRFRVWDKPRSGNPSFWCRRCEFKGDALNYIAYKMNLYKDGKPDITACCEYLNVELPKLQAQQHPTVPRPEMSVNDSRADYACFEDAWQAKAKAFFEYSFDELLSRRGKSANEWLINRGIPNDCRFEVGFNPVERNEQWGSVQVWLPVGIVVPWWIGGLYWNMRIRRRDVDVRAGADKYISVKGAGNGLYNVDSIGKGYRVFLTEGEFDAMVIRNAYRVPGLFTSASIGSVTGARALRWVTRLAIAKQVYICFDADEAGDKASEWWLKVLTNAERLRPTQKDVTDMWKAGEDVHAWLFGSEGVA